MNRERERERERERVRERERKKMDKLEQKIEKYLLLNLLTVIRHYGNTYMTLHIMTILITLNMGDITYLEKDLKIIGTLFCLTISQIKNAKA